MADGWGVYDLEGNLVFDVDSVLDLKQAAKAKVASFPLEQGSFATYNKVLEPFTTKVRLAVGGQARMSALQAALDAELGAANLYNVVTPTATYLNVTLEAYDYSQAAENGKGLLVADLAFLQVREVTPAYTTVKLPKPKNPASSSKVVNGKAQGQAPAQPPPLTWSNVMSRAEND